MIIKQLIDEDIVNYKKPSMFIGFPTCTWKCEKDCGQHVCQNSVLVNSRNIEISTSELIERYLSNKLSHAIVCGGLEPFDSFEYLFDLICSLRRYSIDDVVIYTGYDKSEIESKVNQLKQFKNIIIKFGRFVPNQKPHLDELLGVNLANDCQYAEKIS